MESIVHKSAISNITGLSVGERDGAWVVRDGEAWRELTAEENASVSVEYDRLYRERLVPKSIAKWQAELILHDMGMLTDIKDTIMTNTAMAIVYDGVTTFERTNGLITQVARLKNIPDNTIDKMFIAANRYTAGMATDESARLVIMQEVLDGVDF